MSKPPHVVRQRDDDWAYADRLPFKVTPEQERQIDDDYRRQLREIEEDRLAVEREGKANTRSLIITGVFWLVLLLGLGIYYTLQN